MGSGPAGPAVAAEAFQKAWSTNEFVLVGIGDSVTAGFGASEKHDYFDLLLQNDDTKYPEMQGRDLQHVLTHLAHQNLSVSYTVSEEHLDQLPGVKPQPLSVRGIVVVTTGGNDLIHDYGRSAPRDGAMYGCTYEQALQWKENFRVRLKAILNGLMRKFPGRLRDFLGQHLRPDRWGG